MKKRLLCVALSAALFGGCASDEGHNRAMRIEPAYSIHHGVADGQVNYLLGRYFQGQFHFKEAEQYYRKALAVNSNDVNTLNALGTLYAQHGELSRAVSTFEAVTALAPEAAYLYNNLGFSYLMSGDKHKAYENIRKALTLDPKMERAWANLESIARESTDSELVKAIHAHDLAAIPVDLDHRARLLDSKQSTDPVLKVAASIDEKRIPVLEPSNAILQIAQEETTSVNGAGNFFVMTSAEQPVPLAQLSSRHKARLELSNGNGVSGFVARYGKRLSGTNLSVTHRTNQIPYVVKITRIVYRPGYDADAQALRDRVGVNAQMIESTKLRSDVDIRLVLGKDVVNNRYTPTRQPSVT